MPLSQYLAGTSTARGTKSGKIEGEDDLLFGQSFEFLDFYTR